MKTASPIRTTSKDAKATKPQSKNSPNPQKLTSAAAATHEHAPPNIHASSQSTSQNHSSSTTNSISEQASALVIAASNKAGMEGIDRAKIDAIILRESADSAYMRQQQRRDGVVNAKIHQLQQKLRQITQTEPQWQTRILSQLNMEIQQLLLSATTRCGCNSSSSSTSSTCVVVDMDMFYMACELLSRPELRDVPAVVGHTMILTSNYCARKYGVRAAMAGWIGDKLVEELSGGKHRLVHIPAHFKLYSEKSQIVRRVLQEYDGNYRAYSLDEVYLDIGPYLVCRLQQPEWTHEEIKTALLSSQQKATNPDNDQKSKEEGDSTMKDALLGVHDDNDDDDDESTHAIGPDHCAMNSSSQHKQQQQQLSQEALSHYPPQIVMDATAQVVAQMRAQVHQATGGLTCSAGVAPNFMLAKIASDMRKPNGQELVPPSHESVLQFLHPLPIRKIPGIGRVTEKQLHAFGIATVQDLYQQRALVRLLFAPATAGFLLRASLGLSSSSSSVSSSNHDAVEHIQKGISRERTFPSGRPWTDILARLQDIAQLLSQDMVRKDLRAHTLTVKVKLHTFDVLNKSRSLPHGTYLQGSEEMLLLATELLTELRRQHLLKSSKANTFSVRLLGIRCSNFQQQQLQQDPAQTSMERFLSTTTTTNNKTDARCSSTSIGASSPTQGAVVAAASASSTQAGVFAELSAPQSQISPVQTTTTTSTLSPTNESYSFSSKPTVSTATPDKSPLVQCPLCKQTIPRRRHAAKNDCENIINIHNNDDDDECYNRVVNQHIDGCLNASVVRQAVRAESVSSRHKKTPSSHGSSSKRQRLTDYFRAVPP